MGGPRPETGRTLERKTPRESAGLESALPARVDAQKSRLASPCCGFIRGIRRRRNGKWVHRDGNMAIPRGKERLRRGESQGRGGPEIRFTRTRGEETAMRVAKP